MMEAGKISTWLCQIAKHLWYQELDRRARKGTVPLPDAEMAETGAVEDQVVLRQEKMGLFRKIHGLNETEKGSGLSEADRRNVFPGDRGDLSADRELGAGYLLPGETETERSGFGMKCEIIRDLLPNYVDHLTSRERRGRDRTASEKL